LNLQVRFPPWLGRPLFGLSAFRADLRDFDFIPLSRRVLDPGGSSMFRAALCERSPLDSRARVQCY